jgi:tRNA threonylcarbamoyl adenosine modification protein (Sua5/YciO/YrdC/YwlC family)
LPTDTVYGLAACAQNHDACQELYHVKGRENAKPLAICVGTVKDVYKWGNVPISDELLNALLPGPVTLLLQPKKGHRLPLPENPELVGIRVPDHDFPRAVADELGLPIALTSANVSGEPSSLDPQEFKSLWSKLSAVFDGGIIDSKDEVNFIIVTLFLQSYYIAFFFAGIKIRINCN